MVTQDQPIVFLHLPKTGGQTIHHAVGAVVGARNISPLRVMSQVKQGPVFPPGYRFHSGHLDWTTLEEVAGDPFVFTVLRDPRERLGSFYFFMREEMRKRVAAGGTLSAFQAAILDGPSAVFFSDDARVQQAVDTQWTNVMTTYLATRRLTLRAPWLGVEGPALLQAARANLPRLSAIYRFGAFDALERDLTPVLGRAPQIGGRHANPGPLAPGKSRWQALLQALESDAQRDAMDRFVDLDLALLAEIPFRD